MTTAIDQIEITKPGVYDIDADTYHADPVPGGSLSSGGARKLLPPSCPALFRYEQDKGQPPKAEFELGHAAHKLVLGRGADIVVIDVDTYNTKVARADRDCARAEGKIPLKAAEWEVVQAMAAKLREHPYAAKLFDPERGTPEQSLFWRHPSGLWCRARPDFLPHPHPGRMILPDYKTAYAVDLDSLQKALHDKGYYQQAAWYLDGARALGLADERATFVFVCQMKTPPYLVTLFEPDPPALRIGRERNLEAVHIYLECKASGRWPGFSDEVELISLPPWVERQYDKEIW